MARATPKTLQRIRRLLALTLAALAGVVAFADVWTTPYPSTPTEVALSPQPDAQPQQNDQPTIVPTAPPWNRAWRGPLYDPPPPPPPKVVKKVLPPLRAKLLGTIIEPGASKAMINASGRTRFLAAGDPLGPQDPDAVLVEIGPSSVKVRRGEEVSELKVESPY